MINIVMTVLVFRYVTAEGKKTLDESGKHDKIDQSWFPKFAIYFSKLRTLYKAKKTAVNMAAAESFQNDK
jgi:hypothetical protein